MAVNILYGLFTKWIFKVNPTDLRNVPSGVLGFVSLPDGGRAAECVAPPQHDDERHQQESRDGCQGDEEKEAWQRKRKKWKGKNLMLASVAAV